MTTAPDQASGASTEPGLPVAAIADEPSVHAPRATGTRFVFIDTEATGLDHARHELTEVAWIVRFEDGRELERQYFPTHTTDGADPDALELTHYQERIAPREKTPAEVWLRQLLEDAQGAVLVGAVPDFDARHLELMCRKLHLTPTWDHHLLDVETLALPLIAPLPETPRSLAKTCEALGLPHDRNQAHGALYDAQQAMRAFDRVWDVLAELRAMQLPLPPPVPRPRRDGDANGAGAPDAAQAPVPTDVTDADPSTNPEDTEVAADQPASGNDATLV